MWPGEFMNYLAIAIGVFFILSGVYSCILYFRNKETRSFVIPVVAVGSALLGAWLILSPLFFVRFFMYFWGALLVLAGVQQIVSLALARKWSVVSYGYYVLPTLILLAGILVLVHPIGVAANTLVIIGVVGLLYGLNELVSWYKFRLAKIVEPDQIIDTEEETDQKAET
ncbi:hypothetical protein AGMMS49574_01920 [Bacteroidia bacterium]|nr:hypothetical protein AGMMS49574_01920 [Bacteroidia bacterium]